MSTCHRWKVGQKRCRVGAMSLATSCDIAQHHAIGSGSGSGAGGVRCHSTEGVAEERRGGGSGSRRQAGVGSRRQAGVGSRRQAGVGSVRGSPYNYSLVPCCRYSFHLSCTFNKEVSRDRNEAFKNHVPTTVGLSLGMSFSVRLRRHPSIW